jgi:hypothetical protein
MNTKFKEITYEVGNGPNGLKVSKSVMPVDRMEFNEWASHLNVSGGYVEPPPSLSAMEMISRYGVQGSGSYKVF